MGETKAVFIHNGGPLFGGFAHFEEGKGSWTYCSLFKWV